MDRNADASPSPFRRFPWVQLAFCVACLGMCGYLWMRYSYAWELTPKGLGSFRARYRNEFIWTPAMVEPEAWPSDSFVRLTKKPGEPHLAEPLCMVRLPDSDGLPCLKLVETFCPDGELAHWCGGEEVEHRHFYGRLALPPNGWGTVMYSGHLQGLEEGAPIVRAEASRFHAASVAGIVVGAMGCFVFGLYLRRWLRERKARAS